MATLLLSDLHLPAKPSTLRDRFIAFLQGPAQDATTVYLLGDVFEYWIGDDLGLSIYQAEISALAALTAKGVAVHLQHGNRDFLIGKTFERRSGVHLLPDPALVDIEGQQWLLSHGDQFCVDDRAYQRWRRFSRNALAQWLFLKLPANFRLRIAGGLRSNSHQAKTQKSLDIMDAAPQAVDEALKGLGVRGVIHGHTHRPAEHRHLVNGTTLDRLVLADWREDHCEYLEMKAQTWRRVQLV